MHSVKNAILSAVVLLCAGAASAEAKNCVWTGAAGDGRWSTPGNWEGGLVPVSGDTVSVSGAGAVDGEVENDISGLTLSKLVMTGTAPFRLEGEALAFSAPGEFLAFSASAAVTNALSMALPDGECEVSTTSGGGVPFVLSGVISGEYAKLVLPKSNKNPVALAGGNTYGGGTSSRTTNDLFIDNLSGCGKEGSTLEAVGTVCFRVPGTIKYALAYTGTGTFNLRFAWSGRYEFSEKISGVNATQLGIYCGPTYNESGLATSGELVFLKEVEFPDAKLYNGLRSGWTVECRSPMAFKEIVGHCGITSVFAVYEYYATNAFASIRPSYAMRIHTKVPDAFSGNPPVLFDGYMSSGTGISAGELDLCGNDQRFDRLSSGVNYPDRGIVRTTGGASTLTLSGTASAFTYAMLSDDLSVVWNAADSAFTQTFSNRVHTMSGALVVSNGTLEVAGASSFAAAKLIEVASGGRLLLDTSLAGAFAGVERIDVAAGGKVEVVSGASPFSAGGAVLNLETGAEFILPETDAYDFLSVTLDGEVLENGVYTEDALPGIRGGRIISRGVDAERVDAVWSGAGEGGSVASAANWEGGAAPALNDGSLYATFGSGGASAEIDCAVDWLGMKFTRDFTIGGSTLTLREEGIVSGAESPCTNVVSAPIWLRDAQEWNVGAGSRLDIAGGVAAGGYGAKPVHKTGPGELRLDAPSPGMGAFTLGSTSVGGGTVYVNASTNAFGEASDDQVKICSVNGSSPVQGKVVFETSTVVERPFKTEGSVGAWNFSVDEDVTVRFTRLFWIHHGNFRMSCGKNAKVICEGGAEILNGWSFFSADSGGQWIFRGDTPARINYLYLFSPGMAVRLETPGNQIGGVEIKAATVLEAASAYVLDDADGNGKTASVAMSHSGAVLSVSGDQNLGRFVAMTGGAITSAVPSTVYFTQSAPVTNSAVRITGTVVLYKRGEGLFVQDCAADTTGGIGVSEGTLRLTERAKFADASEFRVEGTAHAEVEARNLIGRNAAVRYESTATLDLAGDQRVKELYIDGVKQPCGIYGSEESGAPNTVAGFSGAGRLVVGEVGFFIRIR